MALWEKKRALVVIGIVLAAASLLGMGAALVGAEVPPKMQSAPDHGVPAGGFTTLDQVESAIVYQGRLLDNNGSPVNGAKELIFRLYDASSGGTLLSTFIQTVAVSNGVFNVNISVPQSVFDGRALWLEVQVSGDASPMTPRQKIQAVPYALGLVPGAAVSISNSTAALRTYNASGFASFYGSAESGVGVYGYSGWGYGVQGYSATGYAGVFGYSPSRNGVSGSSDTGKGVYGNSNGGQGVYGYSASGQGVYGYGYYGPGVYGFSGAGLAGVYGLGTASGFAGVYGSSTRNGVYGESSSGNGIYGYSGSGNGIYGSTSSGWAGYFAGPVYISGTLTVTGAKSGYVTDIARNSSGGVLHTGDVVVIAGSTTPVVGDIPTPLVTTTNNSGATGVIGVVAFSITSPATVASASTSEGATRAQREMFSEGEGYQAAATVQPGELLMVVTFGSFKAINVDASYGPIRAGDLLVTSPRAGYAMRATSPAPGTIVGKALGSLASGTGQIPLLVTLQ